MKLHELRSIRAVVASGFRVTAAAEEMHTSQPGISRHLLQVEKSLGVDLFERRRNRLVGLTTAGQMLIPIINRALDQVDGLQRVAGQLVSGELGSLVVATSHTHARYLLPPVIEKFIREYPTVRLTLRQGYLSQITDWLNAGEADISISTVPSDGPPALSFHPFSKLHRVVLAPPNHPLLKIERPTLRDLAVYPIITYGREFGAYAQIQKAFESAGLTWAIALSTGDTDTIKTYTMSGLGIAIVADTAFEPRKDRGLRAIDVRHLFPSSIIGIGLNHERPINPHMLRFIELLAPELVPVLAASQNSLCPKRSRSHAVR